MNASAVSIVVEGRTDASILQIILRGHNGADIRYFAAQGRVSLATVGRNIMVHEGGPVLLVMDSHTADARQAAELKAMARLAMGSVNTTISGSGYVSSGGRPESFSYGSLGRFEAFIFLPKIEVVFFEAPQALARMLKREISREKVEEGLLIPRETLDKLLNETGTPFDNFLSAVDMQSAQEFASGKQATALRKTVEALLDESAVPGVAK